MIYRFRYSLFVFILASLAACNQGSAPFESLPDSAQTISLLGDTLFTNPSELPERLTARIDSMIDAAEADGDDLATMMVWQARKKGYQGEYREAVNLLSAALIDYPNDARLYRHRGHRYLTLRAFDYAIQDFETAAELIQGTEDIVEPDGLPNSLNQPTSTLHTNIWYHLGLAYYLNGDFDKAQQAYQQCILASNNDDMRVAALYWYYMTLKRMGKDVEAGEVIEPVKTEMDIIENDSYHQLLLVFKGEFDPEHLLSDDSSSLDDATLGYGLGNWHYINGRKERARAIWQQVYDGGNWAAFGYIASEADLARI